MANSVTEALDQLGVNTGGVDPVNGLSSAISDFNQQNLSPADIYRGIQEFPRTVGGVLPDLGARFPEVGRIPLPFPKLPGVFSIPDVFKLGTGGTFDSIRYGYDMNAHQPKFKFLFKVKFEGFGSEDFYYFVTRCDKPRVKFNHQDVNYYNFRTRVLTSVTYDSMNITFLDEIGNTVNEFFTNYLMTQSGTGSGNYGINQGFGPASSSKPYTKNGGYSTGKRIIIEQVFANGTHSNRFMFNNPRIESFEFDELNMEENAGSLMSLSFSYDSIEFETVQWSTIHTWGATDLLRGGGTSGPTNGGSSSGGNSTFDPVSAGGSGIGDIGGFISKAAESAYDAVQGGLSILSTVPGSISDMISGGIQEITPYNHEDSIGSSADTISSNIQGTLQTITSGDNMTFRNNDANVETFSVSTPEVTVYGLDP